MAATANFFVRTGVGIGQLAIELAYAYRIDFCTLDREGATFPVSLSDSIGLQGEATIDISATELRSYGDPGLNRDTALELFEYDVEIEFSRNTSNAFQGETDRLGRALYDLFQRNSRVQRPMAYVVDEGTNIAAVSLPWSGTRTLESKAFIRDAALREELISSEVREFTELPVRVGQVGEAVCLLGVAGDSVYLQPLLSDTSRNPTSPGVVVDIVPGIEPLLGEALAAALWRSATATTGETAHYAGSENDALNMDPHHRILEASVSAGQFILSWVVQESGKVSTSGSPDVLNSGGTEFESFEALGALVMNSLRSTKR